MENQRSNSGLKAISIALAVLLAISLVYIYKITSDANETQTLLDTTKSEKATVIQDLEDLKSKYDTAIVENTTMSDELTAERDKVVQLLIAIKKSKGDAAAMAKYKSQFFALQEKMNNLLKDNEVLKNKNTTLTIQRDSTVVVLGEAKKYNEVLVGQNEELSKTVEKGSKLNVLNLKTAAYKIRSSGKTIETDKAGRADVLKISFTIAENAIAKSGDKKYYVQVIDSKNNVLGDKKTENFGDKSLTYSFISNVKYENKSVDIYEDLTGSEFAKGTYFVNIFDKTEIVSKTSFTLK